MEQNNHNQQGGMNQPPVPPYGPYDTPPDYAPPGKGMATGSLVLGIVSIVFSGPGIILGIIGLILAIIAKKKGFAGGTGTAGLILSIIGIVFGIIAIAFFALLMIGIAELGGDLWDPATWVLY